MSTSLGDFDAWNASLSENQRSNSRGSRADRVGPSFPVPLTLGIATDSQSANLVGLARLSRCRAIGGRLLVVIVIVIVIIVVVIVRVNDPVGVAMIVKMFH